MLSKAQLLEAVSAYTKYKNHTQAALSLGIPRRTFSNRLAVAADNGLIEGWIKENFTETLTDTQQADVPDGHAITGLTTLYKFTDVESGAKVTQFVKTKQLASDRAAKEAELIQSKIKELEAMYDYVPVTTKAVTLQKAPATELLSQYVIADLHVGQYSWQQETGANWNTEICRKLMHQVSSDLISRHPNSQVGYLCVTGDFNDSDGKGVTPTHGHVLDTSTKFPKILDTGLAILVDFIDKLRNKHNQVVVSIIRGNHDVHSHIFYQKALRAHYRNESNVCIIQHNNPFSAIQWGKVMVCCNHSDKIKLEKQSKVFTQLFPEMVGSTLYRYIHTGHLHFYREISDDVFSSIQHPSMVAPSAHSIEGGWISDRKMCSFVYNRNHGEIARISTVPSLAESLFKTEPKELLPETILPSGLFLGSIIKQNYNFA